MKPVLTKDPLQLVDNSSADTKMQVVPGARQPGVEVTNIHTASESSRAIDNHYFTVVTVIN